jgi:ATP-binding cassette subfamily F protein 3
MIGYYDQEQRSLNPSKTIFDEISDAFPRMTNTEIRNICATFLFRGDDVFKTIDSLSGGEKGRVVLIKLLLNKANFLVLDEPTNHLDIQSKEILEDALLDFPGTILFISHDRYFINKIATKIVDMNAHGATTYIGDYDYFMAHKKEEKAAVEKKVNKDYLETKTQRSMDRKIKNKIKKVEEQISLLEEEINNLEQLQTTDEVINDYEKYNEITAQIEEKNNQLEEKMEEWEALNE